MQHGKQTSLRASEVSVDFDPSISFCSSDTRQRVKTPADKYVSIRV